ncbi:uncharacterized protein LOC121728555 isoform X2 [Aricia agestis]|uniref:uncharacterized protein LOC121728555 isoform X2 n=1 Tax=Aricia agestis TaxID=91739 RepID=UPI001C20988E|nr:uncharacterized protein LOC121728555 isoform X2 [Aricia agestis]
MMESRGRKMLALLERNKNDTVGTSEEQCTSADSSSKGVTQTPKENSEETDAMVILLKLMSVAVLATHQLILQTHHHLIRNPFVKIATTLSERTLSI